MAFKIIIVAFAICLAAAHGGVLAPAVATAPVAYAAPAPVVYAAAAPATKFAAPIVAEDYDAHPQYSYGYGVEDTLTGDSKTQQESRDGDIVHGSYSVVDPDGTKRTVDYTADPVHGFNAVVRKEPLQTAAVKVAAAPVLAKVAAPVTAYAPLTYSSVSSPVAKIATPYATPAFLHH